MRFRLLIVHERGATPSWLALLLALLLLAGCATPRVADPLPSWNEGPAKGAIVKLIEDTTRPGSPDFVPPAERIATFDNDGTLWCEHPMYVEAIFTRDRIRALAAQNPQWRTQWPYSAMIGDDPAQLAKLTGADYFVLLGTTHAGLTTAELQQVVGEWLATARHPRFQRPYTDLVYQPMLEVLAYFRANGYKTFIVSGGTPPFMRVFAERAYGIPPEQVIGTTLQARYAFDNDVAITRSEAAPMLIDDGPGKAVAIDHYIGRTPIAAFGNSDGDVAMLQVATNSPHSRQRKRLSAFVWHTDGVREYAYDRDTSVGRLSEGLDLAPRLGWTLVSMKDDWKVIFPFEIAK